MQKEGHRVELHNQKVMFDEQKALFNEQLAEAATDAAFNRQLCFDTHKARAALDAKDMKDAFERLSHDRDDRKTAELAAAKVRTRCLLSGELLQHHTYIHSPIELHFSLFQTAFICFCPCVVERGSH